MTDLFTFAVPVAVITTGFDPETLQLVPEVPVSPSALIDNDCAFAKAPIKTKKSATKILLKYMKSIF
jgi:hypothetical protein